MVVVQGVCDGGAVLRRDVEGEGLGDGVGVSADGEGVVGELSAHFGCGDWLAWAGVDGRRILGAVWVSLVDAVGSNNMAVMFVGLGNKRWFVVTMVLLRSTLRGILCLE